jgi:hypothetical protein
MNRSIIVLAIILLVVVIAAIFLRLRTDSGSVDDVIKTEVVDEIVVVEETPEPSPTPDESFVVMETKEFSPEETRDIEFIYMDEVSGLTPRDTVEWMIQGHEATDVIESEFEYEDGDATYLIKFCLTQGSWDSEFEDETLAVVTFKDTGEIFREVIGPASGTIWTVGPNLTMKPYGISPASTCP